MQLRMMHYVCVCVCVDFCVDFCVWTRARYTRARDHIMVMVHNMYRRDCLVFSVHAGCADLGYTFSHAHAHMLCFVMAKLKLLQVSCLKVEVLFQ